MTAIINQAENLVQQNKFSDALKILRGINPSGLNNDERGQYLILYCTTALNSGDYSVKDKIEQVIELYRHTDKTEYFAKAKHLLGWYYSSIGEYINAKEQFSEAYSNFIRCNNKKDAITTLNRLSFVNYHSGNTYQAIIQIEKCIKIYEEINNFNFLSIYKMNLAYLYLMAGKINDSLNLYQENYSSIVHQGQKNTIIHYIMSALPYAVKGDILTAKKTIEKAIPYLDSYKREKAIYYENLGFIHNFEQKYEDALNFLNQGLEISLDIAPKSALISQIKRLLGDTCLGLKEYDKAEKITNEALDVAEHLNERVEIAACYRIFAQLENHKSNHVVAREWFKKAIDLFSMISSRYELATTRLMAAQSGLYHNGEKTALLYLAKEYFESEDLGHLTQKVDAELQKRRLDFRTSRRNYDFHGNNNGADEGVPQGDAICRPQINPPQADGVQGNDKEVAHSAKGGRWENKNRYTNIVTINSKMKKILEFAQNISRSDMNVLITGDTGTGKDLLAKYIHCHSERKGKFVTVNATAIPHDMIEAELFGYCKGAFTGAIIDKPGLFEDAHDGTFYLNEIADSTAEFQAKLLEILETREVRRLGENKKRPVNFRLIAATNFDLKQSINENIFRLDLYHRLNEIPIHLPPLQERLDDISGLLLYFLEKSGFDINDNGNAKDIECLAKNLSLRNWDGNIRQFKAEIHNLWLVSHGDITVMNNMVTENIVISESESLLKLLNDTNWNQREAARQLGVSEGTIRYRIKKYDISQPSLI